MNQSLTAINCIEYFEKDGRFYALTGGVVSEVLPGTRLYLIALEAAVSHPDYPKFKKKYHMGNDLVFGFLHDYLSGFNHTADIVDGKLCDADGDRVAMVGESTITPRERDVIREISKGFADKQVADRLHIATNTVITILKNLREKTGATSKYHIVSLAAKAGVI
jgi:DNA-binding CsgD family transcriptional regulator